MYIDFLSRGGRDRSGRAGPVYCVAAALAASAAFASPAELRRVAGHKPVGPGEHPRLIWRGVEQLAALREKAASEWGKGIVYRMHQTRKVMDRASITGRNREVVKEAGFKAAGHAAAYVLEGDRWSAEAARRVLLTEVVSYPMVSRLALVDRASRLHGAALTYDLCHDAWDAEARAKAKAFLLRESEALFPMAVQAQKKAPHTDAHIVAYCAVGLAELALLADAAETAARNRIAACERAVSGYLDAAVTKRGFGYYGESVRQAAFATGIVPFLIARKLVLGQDLTAHAAVRNALTPLVYLAVPDAGMPIIGAKTAAVDRSGLFAMATPFAYPSAQPAVAWVFKQLGGDRYRGVVRPHQALYMLSSGLDAVTAAPPAGKGWPVTYHDSEAGVALLRSGWKGAADVVAAVHSGRLRLLGMGGRWVSAAGPHAGIYSDSPGAGLLDNVFLFNTRRGRGHSIRRVYETQMTPKLQRVDGAGDGKTMVATVRTSGQVKRLVEKVKETVPWSKLSDEQKKEFLAAGGGKGGKKKPPSKVTIEPAMGEGGAFEWLRHVGVDYTGRCGAPVLIVVSDRMTGGGKAPRAWVLHLGVPDKYATEGPVLTIAHGDFKLRATIVEPKDAVWSGVSVPPVMNFGHFSTKGDDVRVVLTLSRGKPPTVAAGARALTIGRQTVPLDANGRPDLMTQDP